MCTQLLTVMQLVLGLSLGLQPLFGLLQLLQPGLQQDLLLSAAAARLGRLGLQAANVLPQLPAFGLQLCSALLQPRALLITSGLEAVMRRDFTLFF
jgi:hypothetical protein